MAKKSMKDAAAAGTSVFDQIASGNAQDTQNVLDVKNVKNAKGVNKKGEPLERLNLKIPAEIKEYLTVAATKTSIEKRHKISLTEYLCELVRKKKKKHKDE